jgi:hypothetical protein
MNQQTTTRYVSRQVSAVLLLTERAPDAFLWGLLMEIRLYSLDAYDFACEYVATSVIGG